MPAPWPRGAEVRVIGQIHGQQTVNVWHFATNEVISDDPDNLDDVLLQLAEAVLACILEQLLAAVTEDWRVVEVQANYIHPVRTDPVVATPETSGIGQRGSVNASFESALVRLRTGGGGKSGRGRKFLPPPGDDDIANSVINPDPLIAFTQFLLCMAGKFGGPNPTTFWRIGVYSPTVFKKVVGGGFDNAFRLVTQMTMAPDLSLLSSRKKGHGS